MYTYLTQCLRSSFDLICGFNHFPNLYTIHKEWKFGVWKSINAIYKTGAPCQLLSSTLPKYCWLLSFYRALLYCSSNHFYWLFLKTLQWHLVIFFFLLLHSENRGKVNGYSAHRHSDKVGVKLIDPLNPHLNLGLAVLYLSFRVLCFISIPAFSLYLSSCDNFWLLSGNTSQVPGHSVPSMPSKIYQGKNAGDQGYSLNNFTNEMCDMRQVIASLWASVVSSLREGVKVVGF